MKTHKRLTVANNGSVIGRENMTVSNDREYELYTLDIRSCTPRLRDVTLQSLPIALKLMQGLKIHSTQCSYCDPSHSQSTKEWPGTHCLRMRKNLRKTVFVNELSHMAMSGMEAVYELGSDLYSRNGFIISQDLFSKETSNFLSAKTVVAVSPSKFRSTSLLEVAAQFLIPEQASHAFERPTGPKTLTNNHFPGIYLAKNYQYRAQNLLSSLFTFVKSIIYGSYT